MMETISKSELKARISYALDNNENICFSCFNSKMQKEIDVKITIKDQESFTDDDGKKWVRVR